VQEAGLKSVQSAGISDLLPSGRKSTNCKPAGMRTWRKTSRDCPWKGWCGRVMVTRSGKC
jgi:hypothetical protein